jgi:hypothetical protein
MNGLFGSEAGSDDIALSGLTVDPAGSTGKIPEFKVGVFDDGKVKHFSPPRRLALFDLRSGNGFPKSYVVTVVLAEKDHGGLSKLVNGLQGKVEGKLKAGLASTVGGAVGAAGGPGGAAIGAVAGAVVDKAFGELAGLVGDEVFPPKTVSVKLSSADHRFQGGATDSPEATLDFKAHGGTYRIICDWRLVP